MLDVQTRMVTEMEELRARHPGRTIALFSHADVIRFTVAHYAGIPTDLAHRLEIRPGSVSVMAIGEGDARIVRLNDAGPLASAAQGRGVEA
jgi:probable phosphoglycerate mutase